MEARVDSWVSVHGTISPRVAVIAKDMIRILNIIIMWF